MNKGVKIRSNMPELDHLKWMNILCRNRHLPPTVPNGGETNGLAVNWLYGDTGACLKSPYEFPLWKADGGAAELIED